MVPLVEEISNIHYDSGEQIGANRRVRDKVAGCSWLLQISLDLLGDFEPKKHCFKNLLLYWLEMFVFDDDGVWNYFKQTCFR